MQGRRILVADDDVAIRLFVAMVFQDEGYEVHVVGDGHMALEAMQALQPDLLLLDIAMPTLSGDRVLQTLRTAGVTVPIIIMTAGSVLSHWYQDGASAILPKPFNLDELVSLVAALLPPHNER